MLTFCGMAAALVRVISQNTFNAKVVTGAMKGASKSRLLEELTWDNMGTRRLIHKLVLSFKIANHLIPAYLSDLLAQTVQQRSRLVLRFASNLTTFPTKTERFKKLCYGMTVIM